MSSSNIQEVLGVKFDARPTTLSVTGSVGTGNLQVNPGPTFVVRIDDTFTVYGQFSWWREDGARTITFPDLLGLFGNYTFTSAMTTRIGAALQSQLSITRPGGLRQLIVDRANAISGSTPFYFAVEGRLI